MPDDPGPIYVVMDAHCALCARGALWIARNDRAGVFRIVPVQTPFGRAALEAEGLDPDDPISWLYVEYGRAYTSLDAVIRVGWRLGGIWKALAVLRLVPPPMQDKLYRFVASRRYRWFGRADLCELPDPYVQRRLLRQNVHDL